jgi:hypothetical protein
MPPEAPESEPALRKLRREFRRLYQELRGGRAPACQVEFYPYSNLTHTIRVRNGGIIVRLSDLLIDAPASVQTSALSILVHRLLRAPAPERVKRRYQDYIRQPPFVESLRKLRRSRGRKHLSSPKGRVYDLKELFKDLNREFFQSSLNVRHLSWSLRRNRRVLGHYDAAHDAIVIDRRLDNPLVPEYVVRYVLFHEMLHARLGDEVCDGKLFSHHRRFRQAERRFPQFLEAGRFIREHLSG